MVKIACRQLAPEMADLAANVELTVASIREAVSTGARLVVLPELILTGYMFESPGEARSVAITAEHPVFAAWAAEVEGVDGVVVGGFAELGDDGLVYNSAAVVDRTGVLAVHRKIHLWDREKLVFTPGTEVAPVVETVLGRLGILICYDLEFPEITRSLALRGAELIVVPTNWPLEYRPEGEHVPEVIIAMAAAHVNRVGVACCDRSGTERGQDWNEASCIIDEDGWILASVDDLGHVDADLDLSRSRDKRLTEFVDLFEDRRPELYSEVTAIRE